MNDGGTSGSLTALLIDQYQRVHMLRNGNCHAIRGRLVTKNLPRQSSQRLTSHLEEQGVKAFGGDGICSTRGLRGVGVGVGLGVRVGVGGRVRMRVGRKVRIDAVKHKTSMTSHSRLADPQNPRLGVGSTVLPGRILISGGGNHEKWEGREACSA